MSRKDIVNRLVGVLILIVVTQPTLATTITFSDNFDDGNAYGWSAFNPSSLPPRELATWRVEDQKVINTPLLYSGDNYKFLLDDVSLSDELIEARIFLYDAGYGGITLWHHDIDNWIDVVIQPRTYSGLSLCIIESINRIRSTSCHQLSVLERMWYTLGVQANSSKGEIIITLDGLRTETYNVNTIYRTGLSGFNSGNAGGEFDDFSVNYQENNSIPEPNTIILSVGGLVLILIRHLCK